MELFDLWKTNSLFNLTSQQPDIDKIYLHAKDPSEAKYQLLINKREIKGLKQLSELKQLSDSKAFFEHSNDMDEIYENIEEYNPNKKYKILIIFHDTLADIRSNEKLKPIVTELFIRGRKLNISLFLSCNIILRYQKLLDHILHILLLRKFSSNHSLDIAFKEFMNLYKKCTANPYSFLVIDATLASDNPLRFRKNFLERIEKLIITTDDKIGDEKLKYDINRKAASIIIIIRKN